MTDQPGQWEGYFWDGTQILRNKLGIHDADELNEAERFLSERAAQQIEAGIIPIPRTYDVDHLKEIHRALAGPTYDWAGEFRTVTIGKKPPTEEDQRTRVFMSPGQPLQTWMDAVLRTSAREVDWPSLNRAEVVEHAADLYSNMNFGHPFREMSGRSMRMFVDHVLEQTSWRADYSAIDPERWAQASAESIHPGMTRPPGGPIDYAPLREVFEQIIVDRQPPAADAAQQARDAELAASWRAAALSYQPPSLSGETGAQRPAGGGVAPRTRHSGAERAGYER